MKKKRRITFANLEDHETINQSPSPSSPRRKSIANAGEAFGNIDRHFQKVRRTLSDEIKNQVGRKISLSQGVRNISLSQGVRKVSFSQFVYPDEKKEHPLRRASLKKINNPTVYDVNKKNIRLDDNKKDSLIAKCEKRKELSKTVSSKQALRNQIVVLIVMVFIQLNIGATIGYAGVVISQIPDISLDKYSVVKNNNFSLINPSTMEHNEALFSSLPFLGGALGNAVGGISQAHLGQRRTLMFALPTATITWISLTLATSTAGVLVIRFLQGMVMGVMLVSSYSFTSEVAKAQVRGFVNGILAISQEAGVLFVFWMGSVITWRSLSVICSFGITVIPFFGLIFVHDSPRWLAICRSLDDAYDALVFYRSSAYDSKSELSIIHEQVKSSKSSELMKQLEILKIPKYTHSTMFLTIYVFVFQFTGNIVLVSNIVSIFKDAAVDIDEYASTVIIGVVRVAGAFAFTCFNEQLGRRAVLIPALYFCTPCLIIIGLFYQFKHLHTLNVYFNCLPLFFIGLFTLSMSFALPILNLIPCELTPTHIRPLASAMLYSISNIGAFTATISYGFLNKTIGLPILFWFYGGCCFVLGIGTDIFIPETKGRLIEETSQSFCQKFEKASPLKYKVQNI